MHPWKCIKVWVNVVVSALCCVWVTQWKKIYRINVVASKVSKVWAKTRAQKVSAKSERKSIT